MLDSHLMAPAPPMSTACPETCSDVAGVATHRAACATEPYSRAAWSRRCAWYAGERQPLLTTNSTPSPAAYLDARRRAPRSAGSSLPTPGTVLSKTVVPSGMAPSALPSEPPGWLRGREGSADVTDDRGVVQDDASGGGGGIVEVEMVEEVEDGDACSWELQAAAITARTRSCAVSRIRRVRPCRHRLLGRLVWVILPVKAAWCCQHVSDSWYADDMRRLVESWSARVAR